MFGPFTLLCYYSAVVGVQSIVIDRLSMCVSVHEHIFGTARPIGTELCVWILCDHGLVLLWRYCATLCTFGFMDNVTFGRNGRDGGKGWQHSASGINYVRDRAELDVYECLFHNCICIMVHCILSNLESADSVGIVLYSG